MLPTRTDISYLIDQYDALFLDSYGVLVDGVNPLPGAIELIDRMNEEAVNYFVVTNDASVSLESRVRTLASQGLQIDVDRIINSGSLLPGYFSKHSLQGSPTLVLGTQDSKAYAEAAGGRLIDLGDDTEPDVVVVGHSGPHDWEQTLKILLDLLSRRFQQNDPVHLVLPNPDFIYPNGPGRFGFGAAAFVSLLEQGLERLHGSHEALTAARLGKPYSPIFAAAVQRAGTENVVMIGDQLETDILGANNEGIDSAVVTTGISRRSTPEQFEDVADELSPRYILASLV